MARYPSLLGARVVVVYRDGDMRASATGTLVADSGKSIFIEEQFSRGNGAYIFRWEIPYRAILRVR